ncbi:MAG: phenol hydroxylase [Haliea sp.]|jgi:phenol hydroxylase P4 protein|nr:phenol hydroxylase [Haliea sp.]
MTVKFIGDSYDFPCSNRVENYGGDMNLYMVWDHHLIYCAPNAYRVSGDMNFRDFLEQVFQPDYAQHPDVDKVDWEKGVWQLENQGWTPDFSKSLKENNIAHNSFIRVSTPGLEGMHGVGN